MDNRLLTFIQKVIVYMIAGMIVMTGWDGMVDNLGLIGGVLAGLLIIFPMWTMNHYKNVSSQADDEAFVDIGLAIGVTGVARDAFMAADFGVVIDALPTIFFVILGAVAGGFVAARIETTLEAKIKDGSDTQ